MTLSASSTLSDKIKRWRNVGKSRGESGQDQSDEVDELGKVWWYEVLLARKNINYKKTEK